MGAEILVEVYADTKGSGRCRSCDAAITWFRTIAGKAMAFDGDPVARKSRHDSGRRLIESYSSDDVHWRTCPEADKWRKR